MAFYLFIAYWLPGHKEHTEDHDHPNTSFAPSLWYCGYQKRWTILRVLMGRKNLMCCPQETMIGFVIALLVWRKDKRSFLFCSFRVLFSYRVRKTVGQSQKVGMRNMFLIKHLKLGLQSKHSTLTIFFPEKTCFYAPNKTFDFHVLRWWASNPRP